MNKIVLNMIRCKHCGEFLKSESINDFKMCKCGACGVDGGLYYLRRIGNREDYDEVSVINIVED